MEDSNSAGNVSFAVNSSEDYFADFYDNPSVLWSSIVVYLLGYIGFAILSAVLWFERSGLAGNYRSLINQLTSFLIEQILIYYSLCLGVDAIRAIYGPLHPKVCTLQIIVKNVVYSNFGVSILSITVVKFLFICVYKAMPTIDDNFFATFIYITSYTLNSLACAAKFYGPGEPVINQMICSGIYKKEWRSGPKPVPFDIYIGMVCLVLHSALSIALMVQKRKIRSSESAQLVGGGIRPTNLDFGTLLTRLITALMLLTTLAMSYFLMTIDPEKHATKRNLFGLFGNYFWASSMIMFILAIVFLARYEKLREAIFQALVFRQPPPSPHQIM